MPTQDTFRYAIQTRCVLADALRLLADIERQRDLHPLIVRVQPRSPRAGALRSYTVTDRLTWGPLRFRINYQADVLRVAEDEVVTVAQQWPGTTVRNRTRLHREADGLIRIEVEITLRAPRPLFRYAFRQARAAHLALASRLSTALAAGA